MESLDICDHSYLIHAMCVDVSIGEIHSWDRQNRQAMDAFVHSRGE